MSYDFHDATQRRDKTRELYRCCLVEISEAEKRVRNIIALMLMLGFSAEDTQPGWDALVKYEELSQTLVDMHPHLEHIMTMEKIPSDSMMEGMSH